MLMAAPATKEWTVDMLEALPDDGNRYEILDGELYVTPSPAWRHQAVIWRLSILLDPYLEQGRVGFGLSAPADVIFDRRNVVEPDLFVAPLVNGRMPNTLAEAGSLLLVVEVLSPSTRRADRTKKRLIYQSFRVPEYWIVDVDARLVERWRPDDRRPEILDETIEWKPTPESAALRIDLTAFFARIHEDVR